MSEQLRVQRREAKTRIDPRLENVLQTGHESAPYIYKKELDRLRFDLLGDKQSEIRRRLRRLSSMEQTVHMEDEARAIADEIMVAASRINLEEDHVETAAPRSEESKRRAAVKRELKRAHDPKGAPMQPTTADLDWCNRVTMHHLARLWHVLKPQGYDLDRRPLRGDRDCEEHVFTRKGQGWRFVGVKGGDMIFDLFRFDPTGEKRLPVFVQRTGHADLADQGVPPSLDGEGDGPVVLSPAEARAYLQSWHRASDIISRGNVVTASEEPTERQFQVAAQVVLSRALRDVNIAIETAAEEIDPMHALEESLNSLGIANTQEFCDYVKKIIPEARLQGMLRYYSGVNNLLG